MDLQERIARVIDPERWMTIEKPEDVTDDVWERVIDGGRKSSHTVARRVIAELGLQEERHEAPECPAELQVTPYGACMAYLMTNDCPHVRTKTRWVTPWAGGNE